MVPDHVATQPLDPAGREQVGRPGPRCEAGPPHAIATTAPNRIIARRTGVRLQVAIDSTIVAIRFHDSGHSFEKHVLEVRAAARAAHRDLPAPSCVPMYAHCVHLAPVSTGVVDFYT